MKNIPLILSLSFLLLACHSKNANQADKMESESDHIYFERQVVDGQNHFANVKAESVKTNIFQKRIIRTADIGLELDNYSEGKDKIAKVIQKHGGFIARENEESSYSRISNQIQIKIPSHNFDLFIQNLGNGLGTFDYRRINTQDVGEEYYDLQTRIKTKKAVEERYKKFLLKAKDIKELLKIENELRTIREEIESKQGRLNYLTHMVSLSTINLNIYKNLDYDKPIKNKTGFANKIVKAFHSGWQGILKIFISLVYAWPILLIIGISIPLVYKKFKHRKI